MKVKLETGEVKELSIIDPESGVNWVGDLIGNAGSFVDGQFVWSEEDDAYLATTETYDWWAKYIEDQEQTERDMEELADELGMSASDVRFYISEHVYYVSKYKERAMSKKCAVCGIEDPEYTWQPWGPDESPLWFVLAGNHTRGFPAIAVCQFCKDEKILDDERFYIVPAVDVKLVQHYYKNVEVVE